MLFSAMAGFALFGKGTEFFPTQNPGGHTCTSRAPVGTNLDTSDSIVAQVEKIVSGYPDIRLRHL